MKQRRYTPKQRKKLLTEAIKDLQTQGTTQVVLGMYVSQLEEVERQIEMDNQHRKQQLQMQVA